MCLHLDSKTTCKVGRGAEAKVGKIHSASNFPSIED